ncbi:DUF4232 domain-containing protein [Streptomyces sp. H51]|uniref:DUF4232 domain-containing protein n=1 Tax=Streptomyces sp. H51 TaxID=3111770 RepID=UPI002D789C25|nr:DUF4232 domain-containing protein [Streptomyces sp. H51]
MRTYRTARSARLSRTSGPRGRLLAAAGVALAALALTACEDGTGTRDEGASRPTTASPSADGKAPGGTGDTDNAGSTGSAGSSSSTGSTGTAGTGADKSSGSGSGSGSGSRSDASQGRVLCNGSNTTVTAQAVPRPLNHLLITVKNTGSRTCDLTYYPVLRFDEMQWVPQPVEASHPQAVTTLAPGESGYAGVLLSAADGSGDGGTTGHKLTVGFQGTTPNSSGGAAATPALPAKGVYYDSTLSVTYWQQSMDDALTY